MDNYENIETKKVETKKKKKGRGKKIFAAIVFLAIIGVGVWYYLTVQMENEGMDSSAKEYEVNINRPEDWDETKIAIPGYGTIQGTKDTDTLNVALFNPKGNPCYFQFTLYLDEGNKELYKSGLVEPGKAVTEVKLSQKITEGEHSVTIKIDTFNLKNKKEPMNGSQIKTIISAK